MHVRRLALLNNLLRVSRATASCLQLISLPHCQENELLTCQFELENARFTVMQPGNGRHLVITNTPQAFTRSGLSAIQLAGILESRLNNESSLS